jgi:signal transduction histidine kinase
MLRVLIVDDDEHVVAGFRRLLQAVPGYHVTTATGAEAALSQLAEQAFDLVLLDVNMPGVGGHELCRRIRATPAHRFLKIVFVSGCATTADRLAGYIAGADDFLCKPIDPDELLAKLRVYSRLKRVEELDDIKGRLLDLFAHETRTPLTVVLGAADALLADDSLPIAARELLTAVRDSGLRLSGLANKTIRLCQLRDGFTLHPTCEPVAARLRIVADRYAARAAAEGQVLSVEADQSLRLQGDWGLIDEAIGYMVDNALRHALSGGAVRLSAAADQTGVRLQVADRGPGIAPDWRLRVFEPFSVRDIMHHQSGHGLSLAIVRAVAELHGGSVAVSDAPGRGALFTLQLPARVPGPESIENQILASRD